MCTESLAAESKVLLVDDDAAFGQSTAQMLEAIGYACVAVPDVARAWALLESETFDVVISDICMKGNADLKFVMQLASPPPLARLRGV